MASTASGYINRELSWLEFNQRVLEEAQDQSIPLLDRLKFLAIASSNLDEFFMVRVGGLQMLVQQGSTRPDPSGLTPEEQLEAICRRTRQMIKDQYTCLLDDIEPALAQRGIKRQAPDTFTDRQAGFVEQLFENEIYPVLTPIAVTAADDFPLLINPTLNAFVRLRPSAQDEDAPIFAVIPFGRALSRQVTLPSDGGYEYILLEEIVAKFVDRFFPQRNVEECVPFRITRNADLRVREDLASDLRGELEDVLDARKHSQCVRLEIANHCSPTSLAFLQEAYQLSDEGVFAVRGPLNVSSFMRLTDLKGFDELRYEPWPPRPVPEVQSATSIFSVLSRNDLLLCHPYDSFEPVLRLVEEAADDPDVLAIKQTLYRTSENSQIVAALQRAAERGKYVTTVVELKARFDEARNIEWATNLEQAGVQVFYGVKGLKTHAKLCIVVRREPHGIQRYVHFGTGNYNESTSRLYSDVSFMTCNRELGMDATSFFNAITAYSQPQKFLKIEAAPLGLRDKLLEMIEIETEWKRRGHEARIAAKLNSLVDPRIIEALYAASQVGVNIRLNVRGICCLRPGVPGLSDNISVMSIVDRFLEHSRILYFYHGGDERVFISSADWMPRNLDRRLELLVPIEDPACRNRLIDVLEIYLDDTVKGRWLKPDGTYERVQAADRQETLSSQERLYLQVTDAVRHAEQSRRTVFVPYRAPGTAG